MQLAELDHEVDQAELDALIEEARRRAHRRRMRYVISAVAGLLLGGAVYLAFGGGGGTSGSAGSAPTPDPPPSALETPRREVLAALEPCPGLGWSVTAAEISCPRAGRLILDTFLFDFPRDFVPGRSIAEQNPGVFRSDGFRCAHRPLRNGGGWHLQCVRGAQGIDFFFTP